MNEQDYNELREVSWRRPLTEAEMAEVQKYLTAHTDARAEWGADAALNQWLEHLPAAPPVASNFTAQVLRKVALETAAENRVAAPGITLWQKLRGWLPKTAFAALVVGLGLAGHVQHLASERAALAKNAVEFSAAVAASDPEAMQDFEPIRHLSDAQPKADIELLALMK